MDELTAWRLARAGETCPVEVEPVTSSPPFVVTITYGAGFVAQEKVRCPQRLVFVRQEGKAALVCPAHGRIIEVEAA